MLWMRALSGPASMVKCSAAVTSPHTSRPSLILSTTEHHGRLLLGRRVPGYVAELLAVLGDDVEPRGALGDLGVLLKRDDGARCKLLSLELGVVRLEEGHVLGVLELLGPQIPVADRPDAYEVPPVSYDRLRKCWLEEECAHRRGREHDEPSTGQFGFIWVFRGRPLALRLACLHRVPYRLLLLPLHLEQRTWRFEGTVLPPLDTGTMWSMCRPTPSGMYLPQIWQV